MRTVSFKTLTITNFKGCSYNRINFGQTTTIKGKNQTGKTTILDAINWLFFGKNSQNETQFSIKNTVNLELNRADHIVEMTFLVNGNETTAKRVYREKWVKKRGTDEMVYNSNESELYWNSVPCTAKEFSIKVSEIVEESLWRILTNPLFFNVQLKPNERRDAIVRMAGEISDDLVATGTTAYQDLLSRLKGQKTLEEYRKEISYQKATLKKILESFPTRIDEVLRSNPDVHNWAELILQISEKEDMIYQIDSQIENVITSINKTNAEIEVFYNENFTAKRKMAGIEQDLRIADSKQVDEWNYNIFRASTQLKQVEVDLARMLSDLDYTKILMDRKESSLAKLREDWETENKRTFVYNPSANVCTKCGQNLPPSIVDTEETQEALFNQAKQVKLKNINQDGINIANNIQQDQVLINNTRIEINRLTDKKAQLTAQSIVPKKEPADIPALLLAHEEYQTLKAVTERPLEKLQVADISQQKEMKASLQAGIDQLKKILGTKDQIDRNNKRIIELKEEEKINARDLSNLEQIEFTIDSFQKQKMLMIEQAVNDKFTFVRFKLFEAQVNGGERQIFETLVHGVPYTDANRAGQINAGIDIINALSNHYGISAPIIIDNAEAVNEFIPTTAQTVCLYVSQDESLVIN